ncbi:MAG: glycosyltransferase [Pirellulales bacterium]|nr:glycosyltransferase [Pirellulales bacterium]
MDFVVYGDRWGELPTSATHLFRHVAALGHRVFWVNTVGRMPRMAVNDIRKAARVVRDTFLPGKRDTQPATSVTGDLARDADESAESAGDAAASSIIVQTAPMIPHFSFVPRQINRQLLGRFHRKLVDHYGLRDEILVSPFPYVADLFKDVPARTLYFCYDEWSAYPGVDTKRWMRMEGEMIAAVDGFFATDLRLMEKCRINCPCLYCPQGVEFEHFAKSQLDVPEILRSVSRPVIGFFGLLSEWVDVELIAAAAERFPESSIVLIGRAIPAACERLQSLTNIVWTGQVTYEQLPGYAQVFDVGIIPFQISDLTRAVNPLKLLEYYALGCPVVSTGMQSVVEVGGPVLVGNTSEEFTDAIDAWLNQPREEIAQQARQHAQSNSWTARAQSLIEFIDKVPFQQESM